MVDIGAYEFISSSSINNRFSTKDYSNMNTNFNELNIRQLFNLKGAIINNTRYYNGYNNSLPKGIYILKDKANKFKKIILK